MENNNEMDLIDLFVKTMKLINRSFVYLTNQMLRFLKFNIKNYYIILPFLVLGFIGAQYFTNKNSRTYYAEFRLKINVNGSPAFYSIVESLDGIREFYPDSAAKLLNLDKSEILKIREIKAGYVVDNNNNKIPDYTDFEDVFLEEDTISVRMNDYLGIRIDARGRLQYEKIKENIVSYLNENPFMKKEAQISRENIEKKIKDIDMQILSLNENSTSSDFDESLNEIKTEGNSVMLKKGKSYSKELMSLIELREENYEKIQIYSDAVTSCSPISVKTKHEKFFYYFVLMTGMYIMSLVLSLLIKNKKQVIQFIKE